MKDLKNKTAEELANDMTAHLAQLLLNNIGKKKGGGSTNINELQMFYAGFSAPLLLEGCDVKVVSEALEKSIKEVKELLGIK